MTVIYKVYRNTNDSFEHVSLDTNLRPMLSDEVVINGKSYFIFKLIIKPIENEVVCFLQ